MGRRIGPPTTEPMTNNEQNQENALDWPSTKNLISDETQLTELMQTLPEVDANADEEWGMKSIEYAPCLNFRR